MAVEHPAADRHVGAVTGCFAGNALKPISSIVPSMVTARERDGEVTLSFWTL